jgi:transcriptional regulator with XRE-family HTH domain
MNCKLREVRIQNKMTLEEVGHAIGRSKQWMSELERGNIDLKYDTAVELARVYGGTPDIFLPLKSKKNGQITNHKAS